MSDALAKARAIADAAMPVWKYRGSIPSALHGRTFDPPTVVAMLDALELLSEAKLHVPHGTALRVDIDAALDRVYDLIGDDRE